MFDIINCRKFAENYFVCFCLGSSKVRKIVLDVRNFGNEIISGLLFRAQQNSRQPLLPMSNLVDMFTLAQG